MERNRGMEKHNNPKSLAMLISSMIAFGTIGLFRRSIPFSSGMIACVRGLLGAGFLLCCMAGRRSKPSGRQEPAAIFRMVLSGIIIAFNWILLFEAYNYTTVSVATLCYYMQPVIVILASCLIFRERMTVRKIMYTAFAVTGMVLVTGVSENVGLQAADRKGILLGLGAAVLYASVVLINKKLEGIDTFRKTTIQLLSAGIVMIPYVALTEGFYGMQWNMKTVVLLSVVGIVHTGICYALYFGSMDGLKTQTIALFSYIDPITALILSAFFLGERMSAPGLAGAVLILGSAVCSEIWD